MTTRHILSLALAVALLAVAAASNAPAKQFLKVSELAARKAQLASGNTAPQLEQAQIQSNSYGDGMLPIQQAQPATDYSDIEAIQRQQQQEGAVLSQSIVNPQPRTPALDPTEQIGLAGSAIEPATPRPRPAASKPVQVATTQPPKPTTTMPHPARAPAAPRPAKPRSVAAATPVPAPAQEVAPKATPAQEAQLAESKRGLRAAEAKLRSVLSRFGRKKDTSTEGETPTE